MSEDENATLLTAEDVAKIMKVSIRLVRKWVAEGALEIVEIGTQDYRITRAELNRFIKERQTRRSKREKREDS
jgi:excisionase family DNA binding protein